MFQKFVGRQITTGFPGSVVLDGPYRFRMGRLMSPSLQNLITAVFGYDGEGGAPDSAIVGTEYPINPSDPASAKAVVGPAGIVPHVKAGGANFFGILAHRGHYVLRGTPENPLAPSLYVSQFAEGEFAYNVTGLAAIVYNYTAGEVDIKFGTALGYVLDTATAAQNPNGVPVGGLVPVLDVASVPAGVALVPNSKIHNPMKLGASAAGKPTASTMTISLNN